MSCSVGGGGRLALGLLNTVNDEGSGRKQSLPDFGEVPVVFDEHVGQAADDKLEQNITSSDVEFLEGEDLKSSKVKTSINIKDKPESTRTSIDNMRCTLAQANMDLSSVKRKTQDHGDTNEIMSVLCHISMLTGTYRTAHSAESTERYVIQDITNIWLLMF